MLSLSYAQKDKLPSFGRRKTVDCPHCGKRHKIITEDNESGKPVPLEFAYIKAYECKGVLYICGIGDKNIMSLFKKKKRK